MRGPMKQIYVITQKEINNLRESADQGLLFSQACRRIRRSTQLVRTALKRQNLEEQVIPLFPALTRSPELMRKVEAKTPDVDRSNIHIIAATSKWRAGE